MLLRLPGKSQALRGGGIPGLEKRETWGTPRFFLCQHLGRFVLLVAPEMLATRPVESGAYQRITPSRRSLYEYKVHKLDRRPPATTFEPSTPPLSKPMVPVLTLTAVAPEST